MVNVARLLGKWRRRDTTDPIYPEKRYMVTSSSTLNTVTFAKRMAKAKWCYMSLLPTFVLLGIFKLYPAINALWKSFYKWKMSNYTSPRFIGIRNYSTLLSDGDFWGSFLTLLACICWGFFTTFAIVMPITYLVYKLGKYRTGALLKRLYVIPMMVPMMVIILYWKFFFEYNFGILNGLLRSIGLENLTHVWLGERSTALPSLLFTGFPWLSGFAFLILLAGFQSIDVSLTEAADLDGASPLRKFLSIDVPLIIPQAKILIILGIIAGLQQYGLQMIMTDGGPAGATLVPGLVMYHQAFVYGDLGYGSTLGVVLFLMILLFTIVSNRLIKSRK